MKDYSDQLAALREAKQVLVIQPENPDGDSLGSALALEEILGDQGKEVTLYCGITMPSYLRYVRGWDRVTSDPPRDFDAAVIVDTTSETLLEKALKTDLAKKLEQKPVIVLDHHVTESTLPFKAELISDDTVVATSEVIYQVAKQQGWKINPQAAENLVISILSDSLGMTTEATNAKTIHTVADLVELGANMNKIENRRRELMRKSPEILAYKGRLLERIEYHLDGALALIHIPWEEIAEYSDKYNPSILVLDEMRLVEGVRLAIAIKTYPDGKITGKIRCNPDTKVAETVASYFGGGGHPYVAGFRTYSDNYDEVKHELIGAVDKILKEHDHAQVA